MLHRFWKKFIVYHPVNFKINLIIQTRVIVYCDGLGWQFETWKSSKFYLVTIQHLCNWIVEDSVQI